MPAQELDGMAHHQHDVFAPDRSGLEALSESHEHRDDSNEQQHLSATMGVFAKDLSGAGGGAEAGRVHP
jgi:hypothetical protein